jgi:hypothetical protein
VNEKMVVMIAGVAKLFVGEVIEMGTDLWHYDADFAVSARRAGGNGRQ